MLHVYYEVRGETGPDDFFSPCCAVVLGEIGMQVQIAMRACSVRVVVASSFQLLLDRCYSFVVRHYGLWKDDDSVVSIAPFRLYGFPFACSFARHDASHRTYPWLRLELTPGWWWAKRWCRWFENSKFGISKSENLSS